ncbi:MAG TPA: LysM peptidoglycan-binding domain-containing protein [Acidobacteriaceae bacterium]|nr:LysM peptidoglycan-binding domain-containing protein [Acidobacteriaceae bacterium]
MSAPQNGETLAAAAAAKAQRDQDLIASVEKAYHAGLDNYQQGQLEAARANFDYAVDLMLRCNCDLRQDEALSAEFDHIVAAVNTLEMDALRQGGLQAEQAESPVDVAGNITTPASANVTAAATAELKTTHSDLPLVMNPYVAAYIDFFTNNPRGHASIVDSLERMGRYKAMIQKVLRQNGLPEDLIYQAVAESGFRPQIVNRRSGAGGMWQFMPWGNYGLEHNAWVDQRFDPVESTEAYAREIKADYDQLGDWYLAMAAYDWGAGNVQRAVQRTGYADFWQLYERNNLPQETKNYVPIILAVTIMAKNPKQYGLADMTPDPPLVTDTVTTDYEVNLRLVSDIVGVPVQEIEALNPSLLRMSTPPDNSFDLHLPAGTGPLFEKEIGEIPADKRPYWRLQTVTAGDTLESVARKWRVSLRELAFVNQLSPDADLAGTDSLVIPLAPSSEPRALNGALYRVRRGDTLVTIADRFGVTLEQLRRWNHLRGNAIYMGHVLYVAEPAHIYARRRYRHSYRGRRRVYTHSRRRATSRRKTTMASRKRTKKRTS